MEREEFKILVKAMKAVYAQPTFIPDKDAFDVWYGLLQDLPYEQANLAIQKYMTSERFPPTIADIRTKATEIIAPVEESMSELQAWALVQRALRNSGYNSEEEFAKLPEACQRAVGTAANLKEWALMDSDQVATIEQSHFIRNYRTWKYCGCCYCNFYGRTRRSILDYCRRIIGYVFKVCRSCTRC